MEPGKVNGAMDEYRKPALTHVRRNGDGSVVAGGGKARGVQGVMAGPDTKYRPTSTNRRAAVAFLSEKMYPSAGRGLTVSAMA